MSSRNSLEYDAFPGIEIDTHGTLDLNDSLRASLQLGTLLREANTGVLGHSEASESSEGSDELHFV